MPFNKIADTTAHSGSQPKLSVAIFRLQDVCVRVQKGMRSRLRTAGLEKAPQIEATFRWLRKRGVRIYLLSDFDRSETSILLDRLGWVIGAEENIECVITDQLKLINPVDKVMYLAGEADPSRLLVVADTPELLENATAAKVGFNVGVTSGRYSYQTLRESSHRTLLDNTIQLVNYLLDQLPSLSDVARIRSEPPPLMNGPV